MKNAIVAIRIHATGEVQEFTSKDAAAKAMQPFGVSRTQARAILAEVIESGKAQLGEGFTLARPGSFEEPAPAKADISALIPEGPHSDASDRVESAQAEPASIPVKAKRRTPTPPRLVSALFTRAGIAAQPQA